MRLPLRSLVRFGVLAAGIGLAALFVWRPWEESFAGCPAIDKLKSADAATDARDAVSRGDFHVLALGGFVGTIPGGGDPRLSFVMEDTTDTTNCFQVRPIAEDYARVYNKTVMSLRR